MLTIGRQRDVCSNPGPDAPETDAICPYCEEALSLRPVTPWGLHVDCVAMMNEELEEAFGGDLGIDRTPE